MVGEMTTEGLLNLLSWEVLAISVMMTAIIILMYKLKKQTNILLAVDHLIGIVEKETDLLHDWQSAVLYRLDNIMRWKTPKTKKSIPMPQQLMAQQPLPQQSVQQFMQKQPVPQQPVQQQFVQQQPLPQQSVQQQSLQQQSLQQFMQKQQPVQSKWGKIES